MNTDRTETAVVACENCDTSGRCTYQCEDWPWIGNDEMRAALEIAGWRYAILIGITDPDPDEEIPQSLRDQDRNRYAHLVRRHEDKPVWDESEAVAFVSEVTGYNSDTSRSWLRWDWPA